ncbi:SDR family oxidoreductase [Cytobacillus suaedae]|nr:SDR family oxidoreductase [Cytobacillus suaedae]
MTHALNLNGKVAIVTGASRKAGIGAAICHALADAGADIFFTHWSPYDRGMPWGEQINDPHVLKEELIKKGVRCEHCELDLSKPDNVAYLLDQVTNILDSPSILVNNAAYSTSTNFDEITAEELDLHYFINIRATTLLSSAFAKAFSNGKGGRIINLTSGQSLGPMPGELAYAATKGAVEAMTVTLSAEVASKGITVNAVNPGPTDTGWMDDELRAQLEPRFGLGRIGSPQDIARLIRFLASDDAEWITGQIIHSEGGFKR